ncbi:hypothetical protein BDZ45DRAFT_726705 [Acephala macrosclerotiorum]|nr:hypothetical protein BDZ45DRAFT_726705 [Acephala macrosclerotiorum]
MFSSRTRWSGIALIFLLRSVAASTCYWPDGTEAADGYIACNSTASGSACCGANDACTTFGWCLGASGMPYRGGCTDSTWGSSACQNSYCQSVKDNYQFLMNCNGGTYVAGETLVFCCSGSNSGNSCCNLNFSLPYTAATGLTGRAFIPDSKVAAVTTTVTVGASSTGSSTASPTSSSTGAASQSSSANTTASTNSSSGVSTGAIAGASVGCAIGGLLLGAALSFLMLIRKHSSVRPSELLTNGGTYYNASKNACPGPPSSSPVTEQSYMPATNQHPSPTVQEAPSAIPNYELDGAQHQG